MTTTLLLCAPAPVIDAPLGYRLDVKFVEGMRAHVRAWGGPVHCVLWRGAPGIPFGRDYLPAELDFELTVLPPGAEVPASALVGVAVAMVSADQAEFPAVMAAAARAGVPAVAGIEYTAETRLQIIRLDRGIGPLRKLRRALWLWRQERRTRALFRSAAGLQCNGFPAFDAYRGLSAAPLLYLDNRMAPALFATSDEMATRAARLRAGAPLRLIHSGRLEPMKGAQDLVPVMRALARAGVDATLDVYGSGSLVPELRAALPEFDGRLRLHDPVDFETELVPISRTQADVFLSCHRQSDPSCTYLEAMGCGLALVGYDNRMWARLSAESGCGLVEPMGRTQALARAIASLDRDREALIGHAQTGLDFARAHDFEAEFARRMAHLRTCAGQKPSVN
ncbi:MAG: hypothetical protein Kow0013_10940 [Pararhodobacter sp.]